MELKTLFSIYILLITGFSVKAQAFLNGSFELTTATMMCHYNLPNPTFNGYFAETRAFGSGNEMDILIDGCYTSGIPDGVRALGIAASRDEFSMKLSAPLLAGESYTISFWTRAEMTFRPRGDVEVGCSASSITFGTYLYTATTVEETWVEHSFTFIAPHASLYITVRNAADGIYWNHVDDFVMEEKPSIKTTSTNVTCFGACDGTGTVVLGDIPPYTYLWDVGAGSQTTATATDLCPGKYIVEVTDGDGKILASEVTITEPEEIKIEKLDVTNISCNGLSDGSLSATAKGGTGALTYNIGAGEMPTGEFITLNSGSYTLMVTDASGCTSDSLFILTEPDKLNILKLDVTDVRCFGGADGIISLKGVGGTGGYTFAMNGGVFSPTTVFTGLKSGTYSFVIKDANNCENSINIAINSPEKISVSGTKIDESYAGACDGEIKLSASGGVLPFSFSIDGCLTSSSKHIFSGLCSGNYSVCITDANGCINYIDKQIAFKEEVIIFVPNAFTPDGDAFNETFTPYIKGIDIYDYNLKIFNRWGELIFESYNADFGWNGTYQGEIVESGVYIWSIVTKEIDSDKKLSFNGHVTILK